MSPTSIDQQGAILCKFDADPNSTPRVGSQLDFGRLKLTVGDNFIPWPIAYLAWAIYTLEYSLGTLIQVEATVGWGDHELGRAWLGHHQA